MGFKLFMWNYHFDGKNEHELKANKVVSADDFIFSRKS